MLSQEIIVDAQKMQLMKLFQSDILSLRLNEIQRLYDAAHITTSRLLNQLHRHDSGMTDMLNSVFVDISYILIDEITKNPEIESLFSELYDARYPNARKYFDRIERESGSKDDMFDAFQAAVRHYIRADNPASAMEAIKRPEFILFSYYTYKSALMIENGVCAEDAMREDALSWKKRQSGNNAEYLLSDYHFVFSDTSERIFDSRMFDKFIRKTREGVADYLGIAEKDLNNHMYELLKHDVRSEDFSYLPGDGIPGITNSSTLHVIQDNYGTAQWFQTITTSKGIRRGSLSYRPDIDRLFKTYCRARVEIEFMRKLEAEEDFPKSFLLKTCRSNSPEIDYQAVCYLYNMDIVYQMFREMQERYYADFSWEQVTHKNELTRNNEVIEDLRRIIRDKENSITSLIRENEILSSGIRKQDSTSAVSHLQELQKLSKTIEQKDNEISRLNERLALQEEFIEMLNSYGEEEPKEDPINISALQSKRYLFVGFIEEALPDLRKIFPNSVFMNTENTVISNIRVDAVICLIRYMSHGMLYKVRSEAKLADTPFIYCKGRSINSVYSDMCGLLN